jgi:hypothetical protein
VIERHQHRTGPYLTRLAKTNRQVPYHLSARLRDFVI